MGDDMNFSLTTFDKSGKLNQIEYALNRVNQGKMSLGIKATNGVVIATDKKPSTVLFDGADYEKMQSITPSTGFVYSGMGPDFRLVVKNARKNAQQYFLTYRELQPVNQIVKETALLMQEYTQSGGVRPFGVSCLVAGYDDDGPQLFQVDPSGAGFGWKATAIGKNYINAKNFLERRYSDDMELDDAVHVALLTLRESYEGEMTENNIEVAVVTEDKVFRVLTPEEVKDYLDEAN
jgi:20S proteasome subunit alpha 2